MKPRGVVVLPARVSIAGAGARQGHRFATIGTAGCRVRFATVTAERGPHRDHLGNYAFDNFTSIFAIHMETVERCMARAPRSGSNASSLRLFEGWDLNPVDGRRFVTDSARDQLRCCAMGGLTGDVGMAVHRGCRSFHPQGPDLAALADRRVARCDARSAARLVSETSPGVNKRPISDRPRRTAHSRTSKIWTRRTPTR